METISKLAKLSQTLSLKRTVICPKYLAEKFYIFLSMQGIRVSLESFEGKIKFAIK